MSLPTTCIVADDAMREWPKGNTRYPLSVDRSRAGLGPGTGPFSSAVAEALEPIHNNEPRVRSFNLKGRRLGGGVFLLTHKTACMLHEPPTELLFSGRR